MNEEFETSDPVFDFIDPNDPKTIDVSVTYDRQTGGSAVVFLGYVQKIAGAAQGLKSAAQVVREARGTNARINVKDRSGNLLYDASLPTEAA